MKGRGSHPARLLALGTVPGAVLEAYGHSRNFMTPDVIGYFAIRGGAAELSEGTDFHHKPIYGVSVAWEGSLIRKAERAGTDFSRMFHSKQDALDYLEQLRKHGRQVKPMS